jgi:hypothetical protein
MHGQAAGEITRDDFLDRLSHRIQPPYRADPNYRRTDQSGKEHQHTRRQQRMQQFFIKVIKLARVLAQQRGASIGDPGGDAARRHVALRQL